MSISTVLALIAGFTGGAILMAVFAAGKAADEFTLQALLDEARDAADRASDAAGAMQARIERALDCVTENSAHVGKKMAKILRGDA